MRSLLALAAVVAGCGSSRAQDGQPAPYTLQQAYQDQLNRNTADISALKAAAVEQTAVNAAILAKLDTLARDLSALKATPPPAAKEATPKEAVNPACKCLPGESCGCAGSGDCKACGVVLKTPAEQRYRVPDGFVGTKAELAARYPGTTFAFLPAPGVAGDPAPFVQGSGCSAAGCSATRGTLAPNAATPGTTLTYSLGQPPAAGTYTGAGSAVRSGSTSGCANGNCAAPAQSRGLFRR